tara:strand:- start:3951 stop:4547 length:597 start_codon:yes stop_codon:yes gene_type:complete
MRRFLFTALILVIVLTGGLAFLGVQGTMNAQAVEIFNRPSGKKPPKEGETPTIYNRRKNSDSTKSTGPRVQSIVRGKTNSKTYQHATIERRQPKTSQLDAYLDEGTRERMKTLTNRALEGEFKARIRAHQVNVEAHNKFNKIMDVMNKQHQDNVEIYKNGVLKQPTSMNGYMALAEDAIRQLKKQKNAEAGRKIFDVK